ncbi:hypothetical protein EDD80_101628 [Anseongella ginsenosidimutans]|uniref:Uncharacterized protein n=1 Tax=Anseongella ginsenosidimutans TaxID=496056 RepID=A0A4R3KY48_9SPHI|nr:hypothetical protein EDD80_101628 [Anseongella ginsenosidimutans]
MRVQWENDRICQYTFELLLLISIPDRSKTFGNYLKETRRIPRNSLTKRRSVLNKKK